MALLASPVQAQALANVNKTTILEGETFVLRLRTRTEVLELDTRPLLTDFRIIRQAQMSSSTIFNNTRNTYIEWELELAPRQTGQLVIPALALGDENTRPIPVQVLPMTNAQRRGLAQQVRIDVAIDDDVLYVGETTTVTLTLLYSVNVNGTFADIRPEHAEWEPVGERQIGTRRLEDGNDYRYTAFTYLYTPTRPGNLVLPEIEFNGQIRQSSWAAAQVISGLRSAPIAITVRDIPAEFPTGATWLAARELNLTEQWSDATNTSSVGDQLTRTTRIIAQGPAAHRLPAMQNNTHPSTGVRIYPETPVLDESTTATTRQSSRTERQSYLFTENGTLTLPAIEVPWWDVTQDELRWATLPARTLTISGAPTVNLPNTQPQPDAFAAPEGESDARSNATTERHNWRYWLFLLASAAAGVILWRWLRSTWKTLHRRHTPTFNAPQVIPHRQGPAALAKNPTETTLPASTKVGRSASSSAELLLTAQRNANTKDWPALLRTLDTLFAGTGWPDCQSATQYWGMPEKVTPLAELHLATQAMVYGAQEISEDSANKLSTAWQTLLAQWPKQPRPQTKASSAHRRLYPG